MSRVDDAYRRLHQPDGDEQPATTGDGPAGESLDRYPVEEGTTVRRPNGSESGRRASRYAAGGSRAPREHRPAESASRREPSAREERPARHNGTGNPDGPYAVQVVAAPDGYGTDGIEQEATSPSTLIWTSTRVLARRWKLIAGVFLVTGIASILYLRSLEPVFRATARLTVDQRTASDTLLKTPADTTPLQQGYLETLAEVMRSRTLAEATVAQLSLWKHPEYAKAVPGATAEPGQPAPAGVVDRFMSKTTIATVPGSTVINVSVDSTDPELSANAANALVQQFINRDLDARTAGTKDASNWIERQLEEQRARVTKTEAALQEYREKQDAASLSDGQNIVVQRLADLNREVTRARTERIAKEELYKRVTDLQDNPTLLNSVPTIAANGYIQQLKAQLDQLERQLAESSTTLGPRHPEIVRLTTARDEAQRRLSTEISTVVSSMKNELLTAQAGEKSLSAALEAQKSEAQNLDRKAVEYAALVREAESNRALYQSLLEQAKHLGLAGDLQRSNLRVLDKASTPRSPVNPVGRVAMILALLAAGVFAVGIGFVAEYLDPRLRTPDAIREQLQLPLLGYLETLRGVGDDRGKSLITAPDVPSRFREEVGRVRASIEDEAGSKGGVLLLTSAEPAEGKTILASNLALSFAATGRRVLLVDCDLRRSQMHSVFGLPVEPGVMSVLKGDAGTPLDAAVHQGPSPTLSLLTAGTCTIDPAVALGNPAFQDLLDAARAMYDWVIIDSPPVLAVSDAQVLARSADCVVFVASADQTRQSSAKLAVRTLRRAHARLIGVVLNRVAMSRFGSFNSSYYGDSYGSYYQAQGNITPSPAGSLDA